MMLGLTLGVQELCDKLNFCVLLNPKLLWRGVKEIWGFFGIFVALWGGGMSLALLGVHKANPAHLGWLPHEI